MASRRSRIKGIATIPQRRKPVEEGSIQLEKSESDSLPIPDKISETTDVLKQNDAENPINIAQDVNDKVIADFDSSTITEKVSSEDIVSSKIKDNIEFATKESNVCQTKPIRRKFIKPLVNIVPKKLKICSETSQDTLSTNLSQEKSELTDSGNSYKGPVNDLGNGSSNNAQKKEEEVNIVRNINIETEITLNEINFAAVVPSEPILELLPTSGKFLKSVYENCFFKICLLYLFFQKLAPKLQITVT